MRKILLTACLALALTGCSTIESFFPNVVPPAPKTLNQQIIAADEAAAGVINSAAQLEKSGVIKPGSTVESVINSSILTVQGALDKASDAAAAGDASTASILLTTATGAITGLQNAMTEATSPTTASGVATPTTSN